MPQLPHELERLAATYGVESSYEDVYHRRQTASVEALLAILRVLGADIDAPSGAARALERRRRELADRVVEPVIVARPGEPLEVGLPLPATEPAADIAVSLESAESNAECRPAAGMGRGPMPLGGTGHRDVPDGYRLARVAFPAALDAGYHRLAVETRSGTHVAQVIAAPMRVHADPQRGWGCFLPLYALRTARNWGAGDFADLADFSAWVRSLGGGLVGTLPLLAAYLDEPLEPSPYAPVTRLFWNEFYVDVESIPEFADCPAARQCVASDAFRQSLQSARASSEVDYRRIMALKRQVLEILAADFWARRPPRFGRFEQFLRGHSRVRDYAAFRATVERRGEPWQQWPPAARGGQLAESDYEAAAARYHLYAQWIAHEQLHGLADEAARGGEGLYLDLPLGVRADGFDVWRNAECYVAGATAGAPPDAFFTKGQNWGFPPLHPDGIRRDGYRHVRDYLAHHMHLARTLRIDHVMGLHRLYWIPEGMPASQGAYVRYRAEEWYAVLALESHRHQTTIIGENLGTVHEAVNQSLARHGVRRMFVVQYELQPGRADRLAGISSDSIASLNTHDMPTFAAWRRGLDIPLRQQLGLLGDAEARRERSRLDELVRELCAWLRSEGWLARGPAGELETLSAIVECLSASAAEMVLVNVEDLWLETQPQNVPGTGPELPNWKCKAAVTFEEFSQRADVLAVLSAVARRRPRADGLAGHRPQHSVGGSP